MSSRMTHGMPSSPHIPASSCCFQNSPPSEPVSGHARGPDTLTEKKRKHTGDGRRHVRELRETALTPHTAREQGGTHRCLPTDMISLGTGRSQSVLLHLGLCHHFLNFKMNVRRQKGPLLKAATLRALPREMGGAHQEGKGPAFLWALSPLYHPHTLCCTQAPTFDLWTRA